MTQNHKDPETYLTQLVAKRGKSGPTGVYLTSVTVVAEAQSDYGYKANIGKSEPLIPPAGIELEDWLYLLVSLRQDNPQIPQVLGPSMGMMYQFVPEGGSLSLNVFCPLINVGGLGHMVCFCQDMLQTVADFVCKIPTTIRFSIGYAFKDWENLAIDGEVEELELTY